MKILFIGGTGVLSTDIVKLCVKKEYEVYMINRGHNNKNVDKKVNIIIGDINDKESIKEKIEGMTFDVVIDFLSYIENELKSKLEIFNNKCEQYIFISSATVYRKTEKGERITEKTEASNHEWDYSDNKLKCEKVLEENYKKTGQKYTIVRPYITYSEKRIPDMAISPKKWTLANRIINQKPVLLWDDGQARCTLTQTKEFAVGIVGLFLNEKAYQEVFHITTDHTLTWKEATIYIAKALETEPIIANVPSDYIINVMPEYKGVLKADKGIDREFDNSKIKSIVPEFNAKTKFEDGIKETIEYYKEDTKRQEVDYLWDGRVDRLIKKYYKQNNIEYDKKSLSVKSYKEDINLKNKIKYYIGKNIVLYKLMQIIRKLV